MSQAPQKSDALARIVASKHDEVRLGQMARDLLSMRRDAESRGDVRDFARALTSRVAAGDPAVIAEIKKASPSKGVIRADFRPAEIARSYVRGGAAALSVLTDAPFFQGSAGDLAAARDACELPVLRKEFIVDPWQVYESRAMGADAILLIVAALDDGEMRDLEAVAASLSMAVLVEAHDPAELDRALALRTPLVGINNRDLKTFAVSLQTTLELAPTVPAGRIVVAESGISTADDIAVLRGAGVRAYLVGESLMRADDPGTALGRLVL